MPGLYRLSSGGNLGPAERSIDGKFGVFCTSVIFENCSHFNITPYDIYSHGRPHRSGHFNASFYWE